MIIRRSGLGALLLLAVVAACRVRSGDAGRTESARTGRCASPGVNLDSAFAVGEARRILSQPGMTLEPNNIQPVRAEGIELGLLISLRVAAPPNLVGGGGLVWVDLETGCAIVLRRYE